METRYGQKKALKIDDAPVVLEILGKNLEEMGFSADKIFEANNGSAGLNLFMKKR